MVWPILAGGLIGAGSVIVSDWLGGSKKEASVYHAPYETYSPQTTYAQQYSIQYPDYNVVINSPLSSAGSKKDLSTQADLRPAQTVSPVGGSPTQGTDMTKIAIIAAVGIVAFGLVTRDRGGKK